MTVKLCECGCGEPAPIATKTNKAKGHVKGHPTRFVNGHHSRRPLTWTAVDCGYETPCWVYDGPKEKRGYGQRICREGERLAAHRFAWVATHGTIPDDLFVLHRCDNPSCVRPDHLFLGTTSDNIRDKFAKGRDVRGEQHPHAKLTEAAVLAIRSDQRASTAELAKRYGVSATHIRRVITHKAWTTPSPPPQSPSRHDQNTPRSS